MTKKYKLGFDISGLIIFLIIMIPNFIWFALPAPNDVLRAESTTKTVDMTASVNQVLFVAAICIIINKEREKLRLTPFIIAVICCILLYFIGWILYYNNFVNPFVILTLTVPPCFSFIFFAIDRKNLIAVIPAVIFTVCHLIYGVVNFIL